MICLLSATFLSIVAIVATADPNPACVPPDSISVCKQFKCGNKNCPSSVSPYLGGNICCKTETIRNFQTRPKRQAYNFDANPASKWDLPIQYVFNESINLDYKSTIRRALNHIEAQSCVRFRELSSKPSSIHILFSLDNQGCVSFVGKSQGQSPSQPILATDACFRDFGQMLYLITQTMGFWHQTQRPDFTNYITINTANMDPSHEPDFTSIPSSFLTTFGLPYDFSSIVHYPAKQFSNNGLITLVTKNALFQHTIGQRVELSFQDAQILNLLYCNNVCSTKLNCMNGGYTNPNNCQICKCPDGYNGQLCQDYDTTPSTVVATNDCGGELVASPNEQILTSPGYDSPQYYNARTKCTWHITAPNGGNISIQFSDSFGIYNDPSYACYHWLEARYQGPLSALGPRLCGSTAPTDVLVSSGNEVLLLFRSNFTDQGPSQQRGFKLTYKVVNAPVCAYVTCSNGGTCINNVCQCAAGYTGPTCNTITPVGSNPCQPNPCRNNGTCSATESSFSCTCLPNMWGDTCQHAPCGGCDIAPGPPFDSKCSILEDPPRTCTRTESADSWSYSWWGFRRTCRKRYRAVSYPCVKRFCCNHAIDLGFGCATTGWSDWSPCDRICGGGKQYKEDYEVVERDGAHIYTSISTQEQSCNTDACPQRSSCGFWSRLFRCC